MRKRGFSMVEFLMIMVIFFAIMFLSSLFQVFQYYIGRKYDVDLFQHAPRYFLEELQKKDFQSSFLVKDSGNTYEYYTSINLYPANKAYSPDDISGYELIIRVTSFDKSRIIFNQSYDSDKRKNGRMLCTVYNPSLVLISNTNELTGDMQVLYCRSMTVAKDRLDKMIGAKKALEQGRIDKQRADEQKKRDELNRTLRNAINGSTEHSPETTSWIAP